MSLCAPDENSNVDNGGQIPIIPGGSGGSGGYPSTGTGVDTDIILMDGICPGSSPIDLDALGASYIKFSAKETQDAAQYYLDHIDASIVTASEGKIHLTVTSDLTPYAGIWRAAFQIYNVSDEVIKEVPYWLYITKSIDSPFRQNTPLSIAEVRLFLMDQCPSDNFLLDDLEFADTEVMAAIRWPVDKWNETPPDVQRFTQTTCPFRYHWMVGAASQLLRMASHSYARNSLDYAAGGVTVRDKSKSQEYQQMSKDLQAEFITWMGAKKVEINMNLAFGGIYSWQFYGRGYAVY